MLKVQNLKKYYSTQKAVDDISFEIQPGSIFGLLGPNGAGKTTLIRMITGIIFPDEGQISLNGQPFNAIGDVLQIGYMPEERGLYKKMKIGEQAMYLAQLKGLDKAVAYKNVKTWFERLEMESWWNKKVEDLSKGMGQKLQFVTTVLHEPKLIILDEPFSGLDPVNANLIKDEIYRLSKEGATIIFSTHRMEQVEEICDQIILVNKGKKILDGTVSNVKQQFKQHRFNIATDGELNLNSSHLYEIVQQKQDSALIQLKEGAQPNDVLQSVMQSGNRIIHFSEVLPSLNEIFISLVEATPSARQFQTVND
ncbi:ABC transporter ATP-binding protein [Gynurincola endophyticus]|jgi:ABC-2 type transport system ATP-binding protein|uniref:ABC transporter ATP-binding protein n=1 Tax=Gynurincola endophyticus TaxID=2479004 RepID=UPI000F8EAAD1|nr:ATP-binding cassette domain-containing protein [Gynurincola endophyticus]